MNMAIAWVKGLTLIHAVIVAVVALVLASVVFRSGLINMVLWIVAVGAAIIGVINYLSYGR